MIVTVAHLRAAVTVPVARLGRIAMTNLATITRACGHNRATNPR